MTRFFYHSEASKQLQQFRLLCFSHSSAVVTISPFRHFSSSGGCAQVLLIHRNFKPPDPCLIINILQHFHRKLNWRNFLLSNKNLTAKNPGKRREPPIRFVRAGTEKLGEIKMTEKNVMMGWSDKSRQVGLMDIRCSLLVARKMVDGSRFKVQSSRCGWYLLNFKLRITNYELRFFTSDFFPSPYVIPNEVRICVEVDGWWFTVHGSRLIRLMSLMSFNF